MRFVHESLPQRVVFATGEVTAALAAEVAALGASRAMLIAADPHLGLAEQIAAKVPVALRHEEVVMHVPAEVAERARAAAAAADVDVLVSVGGGSATGLAKAIALTSGLPIIAVPTTYAGSEATNVWGLTSDATKTTGVDPVVLPVAVVYDASLLASLPTELTVASGLNALAHGVDSMWGPRADPIDRALALEGIRALVTGLPGVASDHTDLSGVEQTLYGAYLTAVAFASAGSGMHHKICHVLGGMFNLPHAQTHAVVLPHVLAFNAPHAAEAVGRIAQAFGSPTALAGLRDLYRTVGAPVALRDLGMPEDGIETAVEPILSVVPANNPGTVSRDGLVTLLRAAWEGVPQ